MNGSPNTFDPKNHRVHLAREKNIFNRPSIIVINFLLSITLLAGGITVLIYKFSIGWLYVGFSVLPAMFIFWVKNALAGIPIGKTQSFTDLLSPDLLLLLNNHITPAELVKIIPKTKSGTFLISRFALPTTIFDQISAYLPASTEPIYQTAINIRNQTNSETINGAILAIAIIENVPNYEQFLNQFKITYSDLLQGIEWFNYLSGVARNVKKPIRTGGIARDLAFGYTPTLQRFATNLSEHYIYNSYRVQQAENAGIINQIIDTFTHGGRQNVALVGAPGSGRSNIVQSFAEIIMNADSKIPNSLKYRQIYSLDAPSLISSAKDQGDLEYLMTKIFNEIYSAKNIILCLDNAHLFFEEGPGSIDISNLLSTVLEAGRIRIIMIMDSQKFLEISARNPVLANSLNKIVVNPSSHEETIKILMDQVTYLENEKNVTYTYQSLKEAYRLAEQYIHDIEMPGKAKLLLESAASHSNNGLITAASVQTAVEKNYGVKVKVVEAAEDRSKLLNLEELIHQQMVDQEEAVSAVSGALRRAGAGVKNQNRPIGTFLFLGPTGVGKTELAKTLSRVYFNGEKDIIRLDMNEFVSPDDVNRLIRDGASDALSLTAQVMKRPFSVVLLDEIEKAHPAVLTTLLQVLDEGVLLDEKNRKVSFSDTIIIATSNAGANEIREKISAGVKVDDFKEEFIEHLISSNEFKPEFLNRFDEVCIFKPLSKTDLVGVLDLIITSTNKTLEPQKISVQVTPEAKQILIDRGYDPKMGARPMRRIVQKTIENVVASSILSGSAGPGAVITITPNELGSA